MVAALGVGACLDDSRTGNGVDATVSTGSGPGGCQEGQARECHEQLGDNGGVLHCINGTQICENGVWGSCEGVRTMSRGGMPGFASHEEVAAAGDLDTDYSIRALSDAGTCNNPCDPECQYYNEQGPITLDPNNCVTGLSTAGGDINNLPGGHINKLLDEPCASSSDCQVDHYCDTNTGLCEWWADNDYDMSGSSTLTATYGATQAECMGPNEPTTAGCASTAYNNTMWVDAQDSDGYLQFDFDNTFQGQTVTAVTLRLKVPNDNGCRSNAASGEIWTVDPFTNVSLNVPTTPNPLMIQAADLGGAPKDSWVEFSLPTGLAVANSTIYLGIIATNNDGACYFNTAGTDPPELVVEYDGPPAFDYTLRIPCDTDPVVCNRGGAVAPSGAIITVISGNSNTLQNNLGMCSGFGGSVASQCTLNSTINPGECVTVSGCTLGNGTKHLVINSADFPPLIAGEADCLNNHSMTHQNAAGACAGGNQAQVDALPEVYATDCGQGKRPQWSWIAWDSTVPAGSQLTLDIHTADPPSVPLGANSPCTDCTRIADIPASELEVCPSTGPSPCPVDAYAALGGLPLAGYSQMELIWELTSDANCTVFPTLTSWQVAYTCVDAE